MFSDQIAEISLQAPSKCLDAVRGDRTESRFIAGTCSLGDNHLHVLRFHSELNEFGVDGVLELPSGIDNLVTSPRNASLVLTSSPLSTDVTLYRIPTDIVNRSDELEYKTAETDEEEVVSSAVETSLKEKQARTLPHKDRVADIVWRGGDEFGAEIPGDIVTLDYSGNLTQWDLDCNGPLRSECIKNETSLTPARLACDPHNVHSLCVTTGQNVQILDWRTDTSLPTGTVSSLKCHKFGVTDVDYNPNKPHVLATSGQDGLIKFWDLRLANKPLLVGRGGHTHWVSRVQYNPFHDQLILSGGTDAVVNLWRMSSISSAPLLQIDGGSDISKSDGPNVRVARHEHADSVYDMAWGAADAWIYVSVGYDGKVVLNHVPSNEKYKILL